MKTTTIFFLVIFSLLTVWAEDTPKIDISTKEGQMLAYSVYMLQMEDFLMEAVKKIGTEKAENAKLIFSATEARVLLNIQEKTKVDFSTLRVLIKKGNDENWDYKIFRPFYEEHKMNEKKAKENEK